MRRLPLVSAIVLLGACAADASGALRAEVTGAVSEVPLGRRPPDAELAAACGDGALTTEGGAIIRRNAYLQQTSATSTLVLWTAATPSAMTVRVTTPEGQPVARVATTLDETYYLQNAYQHVARIEELEPGRVYCYAIESESGAELRRAGGFATAPASGEGDVVRFVALGDTGAGSDRQLTLLAQMQDVPFELALAVGGIAGESGSLGQLEDDYFAIYEPLLGSIPFYPVAGEEAYATDEAAPFREVFALPESGAPAGLERWYSFDHGPVHFVALDTELADDVQAAWLEEDLAATEQPWIVVFAHRPPYSSGEQDPRLRELFGPIFERHGVALVISAHDPHYERIAPQNGVTYVVSGAGGASPREPAATIPESAFHAAVVHFVHVTITQDELTLRAIDATGREFDSAVISLPSARAR